MKHDLILHIIRNPYGWADDEVRNARLVAAALIEQQAKQIEALRKLIADIKAWDVDQFITLPHALRKRMQAVLDNAEQTGQ